MNKVKKSTEQSSLDSAMRKILSVSKHELQRRLEEEKAASAKVRRKGGAGHPGRPVAQNRPGQYVTLGKEGDEYIIAHSEPRRSKGKLLLVGGMLGVVGVGFILAAPELGFASAVGGTLAGLGSAGMTLLARK